MLEVPQELITVLKVDNPPCEGGQGDVPFVFYPILRVKIVPGL